MSKWNLAIIGAALLFLTAADAEMPPSPSDGEGIGPVNMTGIQGMTTHPTPPEIIGGFTNQFSRDVETAAFDDEVDETPAVAEPAVAIHADPRAHDEIDKPAVAIHADPRAHDEIDQKPAVADPPAHASGPTPASGLGHQPALASGPTPASGLGHVEAHTPSTGGACAISAVGAVALAAATLCAF